MHSNKLRLILLSSIYALAYLQSYGKQFVMSKPYSSRAFNFGVPDEPRGRVGMPLCMQQVFWLIARLLSLPSLSVDSWQLTVSQWLRYEANDFANHSSGSVQESHLLPLSEVPDEPRGRVGCSLTECGCKGNHFFFIIQIYGNIFGLYLHLILISYLQVSGPP